ncbi:MAG TPA: DinB family protein [Actinomycetota bacterium]|nr:DinB family protein [Actinomycetota bacterium]
MTGSPLKDAFAHHVWATTKLIDACTALTPEQLQTKASGTYGPILRTMQHLVGNDSWYLFDITGDRRRQIDPEQMDLAGLRAAIVSDGEAWSELLATEPDPDRVVTEVDDKDGSELDAVMGVRLAQALHHGTDHRSQICTAMTSLGVEPPGIDVWEYGFANGRVAERAAGAT